MGWVLPVGIVVVVGLGVGSVGIGTAWLTPAEVVEALRGRGSPAHQQIVMQLRLPRVALAVLAGAMLAVAGALLQTISRNDLADPSILGVTSGAALGIVCLQVAGLPTAGLLAMVAGFTGAFAAGGLVQWLGRGLDRDRFLLQGVLVGAVLSASIAVLLNLNGDLLGTVLRWVIGSLSARTWGDVTTVLPWALLGAALTALCARAATLVWLGQDIAVGLGLAHARARTGCLLTCLVLTAGAVSVVGGMAFVGLVAPHLARRVVGAHPVRVLAVSAVLGSALLILADSTAQLLSLTQPSDSGRTPLPAGALTALIGGPTLLWLLTRSGSPR